MQIEVLRTLDEQAAPHHSALLVVDMQNDYCHPNGKAHAVAGRPIDHNRSIIPALARLVAAARRARVPIVYIQHSTLANGASYSGPWLAARSHATFSTEDMCMEGSWGQAVVEELAPQADDLIVKKHNYSGFSGTNLDYLLRARGVKTVIVTGVSTNVCVESTARDAFHRNYYAILVADAVASWDRSLHEATLATFRQRFGLVTTTAELERRWS